MAWYSSSKSAAPSVEAMVPEVESCTGTSLCHPSPCLSSVPHRHRNILKVSPSRGRILRGWFPQWPYTYHRETFYWMLHWWFTTVYVLLVPLTTTKETSVRRIWLKGRHTTRRTVPSTERQVGPVQSNILRTLLPVPTPFSQRSSHTHAVTAGLHLIPSPSPATLLVQ